MKKINHLQKLTIIVSLMLILVGIAFVNAAPVTVTNGVLWYDTDTNPLHAHGGGFLKVGDYYYWFGENRYDNSDLQFKSVRCYRSTNLKDWEFRNDVLLDTSDPDLNYAKIERPKVIYCASTGKYVMWMHKEYGSHYGEARAAVATCDTVDGNYTYHGSFNPLGYMSRDCTAYVDDNGSAYFLSAANENYDLHVYKLTSNYEQVDYLVQILWPGGHREAPAMFKRNGYYFLVTSGCTGWAPNQGKYAYTTDIAGTWSDLIDFGNSNNYDSQPTYVITVDGSQTTSYIYCGDRWMDSGWFDSKYIWLPIDIESDTSISLPNAGEIQIDTETGEVIPAPTPTPPGPNVGLNKPATASSEESGNPVENGNDGSSTTRWCANDGDTGEWWKVDLGGAFDLLGTQVEWEFAGRVYDYKVEVSSDDVNWTLKVDKTSNSSTAQVQQDLFSATGVRYVRITITGLASGTWASFYEFLVFGTAGAVKDMYVNDIAMSYVSKPGKRYAGVAAVWIKDEDGNDQQYATVYGEWSGATTGSVNGATGSDGKVTFESSAIKNGGTYTFTVTNVIHGTNIYNPSLNNETSDSITAPS